MFSYKICSIFDTLNIFVITEIINLFKKLNPKDTGLRGTAKGRLYVDKKVFYNRTEVREAIANLNKSVVIKEQIKANRI